MSQDRHIGHLAEDARLVFMKLPTAVMTYARRSFRHTICLLYWDQYGHNGKLDISQCKEYYDEETKTHIGVLTGNVPPGRGWNPCKWPPLSTPSRAASIHPKWAQWCRKLNVSWISLTPLLPYSNPYIPKPSVYFFHYCSLKSRHNN
jgi:hypothetical protein